jgi:hypothetical protein
MQQINHWEKPTKLRKEPPRNAKIKLGTIAFPIVILLFIWLLPSFFILLALNEIHQEKILRERGIEINSIVISKTLFQGKSKKYYEIWYQFELNDKEKTRTIKQKNSIDIDYGESIYLSDKIPILYDKNNPYISRININNKI